MSPPTPDSGPVPAGVQPLVAAVVGASLLAIVAWFVTNGGCSGGLVDHDAPRRSSLRYTIDINTADASELGQLPGIGPATAARIMEHRGKHGPFATVESLLDVPGIGTATLEGMRPHLRPISSVPEEDAAPSGSP